MFSIVPYAIFNELSANKLNTYHCNLTVVITQLTCLISSMVGLGGLEPPTSRLSGVRSNRLSYKPIWLPEKIVCNVAA